MKERQPRHSKKPPRREGDETPFQFRFVEVRGVQYLRFDDVAAFLRELGGSEETDVRKRLEEAARRITAKVTL